MSDYKLLDKINKPNDIKNIPSSSYDELCNEIRRFLIDNISKNGGHLSSNLGVVELTIALHLFLDLPKDKLIFDVGHQAYVHKLLTGRKDFSNLRKEGGIAGFPKESESDCDAFDTGHSSTSLSLATGFVTARDLLHTNEKVVAVIGDGALGGGMAFEALNNISKLKSNLIIILNDNEMSIDKNEGGVANYLGKIRTGDAYSRFKSGIENTLNKIPGGSSLVKRMKHSKDSIKSFFVRGMFFEDLGITYIGPINGHNIEQIKSALMNASRVNKPVLIHVCTKKGKGYSFAEENPGKFHGIGPFDINTGKIVKGSEGKTFTESFSQAMNELGKENHNVVGITASMEYGTGLMDFKKQYPERFFDVGIAEQHAVTFAAALAKNGFIPVAAIYSSFLQRSYDQILHDVCLTQKHVIFMLDRAGITGPDGETHQGIYDLSFLSHMPGLTIMAPSSCEELKEMLKFAVGSHGPFAIRYPKGKENPSVKDIPVSKLEHGKMALIAKSDGRGKKVVIISCGAVLSVCLKAKDKLTADGYAVKVFNARFVSPIDKNTLVSEAAEADILCTVEDNVQRGGFSEAVALILMEQKCKCAFKSFALPDAFISQGERTELLKKYGIDEDNIYGTIRQCLS